ncbi:MAG: 4-hydroxythreonine-4-phosphate dehydrogenase PdxA [Acidobacteriota bacterium]|nr:4-hydroxythreonine-4-phosphate dehydrogenase PdxA [Acidobacteriota bacterium]
MTPRIGITLGDPGGIGPEVVLKALSSVASLPEAEYVVFGSSQVVDAGLRALGIHLDILPWDPGKPPEKGRIRLRNIHHSADDIVPGSAAKGNGLASFSYFAEAIKAAQGGGIRAVVTAPISKTSWRLAGLEWRGHTEYLEEMYPDTVMTFWSERIRVALLSHHLPLREALNKVRKKPLLEFLRSLSRTLEKIKPGEFELAVAGLNPHAGEDGLLGAEEENEIRPAVREARAEGLRVTGPFPPDTVFLQSLGRPGRMVVALYHDQGLIAFKMEAFADGVNVTLGAPFIRTSPDHGTAFDIAGKGAADPRSMVEAIKLAVDLSLPLL